MLGGDAGGWLELVGSDEPVGDDGGMEMAAKMWLGMGLGCGGIDDELAREAGEEVAGEQGEEDEGLLLLLRPLASL